MNHITKKRKFQYVTSVLLAVVCFLLFYLAAIWIMGSTKAVELPSEDEPKATGMLVIPARLTEQEREIWDIVVQRDNERVLAMKLARMEQRKADAEPEEPEQESPTMTYKGRFRITGYCTCARCCGNSNGITASGEIATVGRTCAAARDLPFGTRLYIEGIGERVVEDRGGFASNVIDVLCSDHAECYAITGWYDVYTVED